MTAMRVLLAQIDEAFAATPAGKGVFGAAIDEIAHLTDINDHGGAVKAAAKLVGAKRIVQIVDLLDRIHTLEQEMPEDLIRYRTALRKQVLEAARKRLSPEEMERLERAF